MQSTVHEKVLCIEIEFSFTYLYVQYSTLTKQINIVGFKETLQTRITSHRKPDGN